MKELIDNLILRWGHDPADWPITQGIYLVGMMLAGMALTTFGAIFAGLLSWWERRIAARMQSRIGPNRVGPQGLLQFLADALKLIGKEDLIPSESDKILFRIAPYFVMTGFVLTFVVLPFGYRLSPTYMNVGLFYIVSITALIVVGILISGWASNSKWALFGGIRAAAQVISYEIPSGMVILVPIIMAGSLNLHDIIRAQGGAPWDWFMFQTPMGYAAFFILFVSLLAEGNRTPFDLPEAESELVSGYNTEYSGMRFAYFFTAEWGGLWVMSALLTTLFLGGWQVPGVSMETLTRWEAAQAVPWWFYVASAAVFVVKVLALVNVIVWIRWTFPRIRVDQMMTLCWKYLVPIGMGLVILEAATELISFQIFGEAAKGQAKLGSPRDILHVVFFLVAGALPLTAFLMKVFKNIQLTGDRVDLSNW
jgi:NADH-quinone oxidoreductase subunit H